MGFYNDFQVPMFNFERESEMREKDVYDNYSVKLNSIQRKEPYKMPPLDQAENHVVVSVSQNDLSLATCLLYQLQKTSPDMRTTLMVDNTGMDMKCLQSAKQIVVFLSRQYLESAHHLEELFISIIRQRNDRNRKILYLCQASELGETPSFAHLLPIDVSLEDAFWKKMFEEARKTVTLDLPELKGSFTYSSQNYAAMTKLADDILRACAGLVQRGLGFIVPLENLSLISLIGRLYINRLPSYLPCVFLLNIADTAENTRQSINHFS